MQPDAGHQNGRDRHQGQAFRPIASRVRITARSFLQNSRSIRFSAIGLTFQVSPLMKVTCSIRLSCGRESGDTCSTSAAA